MAQLIVTATHDYRPDVLVNIDEIIFSTTGSATATFGSNQFGGTGIANNVAITGDGFANTMRVVLGAAGTFSAAGWGFATWDPAVDSIILDGTAGADTITGTSQADVINGGDEADTLNGGAGADRLNGGSGDDTFNEVDFPSGARVDGGDSFDTLNLGAGTHDIVGFAFASLERLNFLGNGTISGIGGLFSHGPSLSPSNMLQVFAGVVGGTQALVVGDTFVNLSNVTFLNWGGPNQTITINGVNAAGRNNILIGSAFADTINAASSNGNSLTGGGGNDVLNGAPSFTNSFSGGAGADIMTGGSTTDTFGYGNPSDLVAGETINGGGGTDTVAAGGPASGPVSSYDFSTFPLNSIERIALSGNVKATFSPAQMAAIVEVDGGDDATFQHLAVTGSAIDLSAILFTDWGANPNIGSSDPTLFHDLIEINGTAGADTLVGSSRNDRLAGGAGADSLTGGQGDDRYVYAPGGGADTVIGFVAGAGTFDAVDVSAFDNIDTFADVLALASQNGADTVINFGGGDTLTLQNVQKSNLHFDDFVGLHGVPKDFGADGKADILWRHDNGTTNVFAMDGATVLSGNNISQQVDNSWQIQEKADFNGDGRADILWRHQNGTSNLYLMNGATVIDHGNISQQVDNAWTVRGAGDFNDDGNADILWRHANGTSNIYLMHGQTVLSGSNISQQVDNAWSVQGVGDFNGDGSADILWRHANGTPNVYLMDGHTVLAGSNTSLQVDNGWSVQGVGDFNGDGNADILWRHANGTSNVFLMDGATVIGGSNTSQQVDNAWSVADTGDYNGDGNTDILWRHQNGTTNVFLMDGATVLGGSNTSVQVDNNWHVV